MWSGLFRAEEPEGMGDKATGDATMVK